MALVNVNSLQKCGSVSKFASCRLPSSIFRCTQFTTTSSNVTWVNHELDYNKNQHTTNSLSLQRKCLSLQSRDARFSSELLSLSEPKNSVLFLPKSPRTKLIKLEDNRISFLKEWARNPLIDHREIIAFSLKDYERCLKSLLESEMEHKTRHRVNKHKNQQKWQAKDKVVCRVQRDWTSSRFGHVAVRNEAQCINNPSRELNCAKLNVSQVNSKKNVDKLSNFDKDLKVGKGKEVGDKPNPTDLANVLLMLREELPLFFVKSHSYELYHKNITFVNNMVGLTTRGLTTYKAWLSAVKITNKMLMSELSLDIIKITKDSQDSTVKVRWRIRGIPRYQIILPVISEKYSYIDGFSVFEVGRDGLIHCHRLERVMPSSSRQRQKPAWVFGIFGLFGLLGRCRPADIFEILDTD